MQYKTITLELLRERTHLHEQLRQSHQLMPTLENLATELKVSHDNWKETLAQAKPGSDARSRARPWKWLSRIWQSVRPPRPRRMAGNRFRWTRQWLSSEIARRTGKGVSGRGVRNGSGVTSGSAWRMEERTLLPSRPIWCARVHRAKACPTVKAERRTPPARSRPKISPAFPDDRRWRPGDGRGGHRKPPCTLPDPASPESSGFARCPGPSGS